MIKRVPKSSSLEILNPASEKNGEHENLYPESGV